MLLAYKYKAIVSYAMGAIIGVRKNTIHSSYTNLLQDIVPIHVDSILQDILCIWYWMTISKTNELQWLHKCDMYQYASLGNVT